MAMINIPVWMSLASCEELRKWLISNKTIVNMLHFGRGVFGSDFGSVGFVYQNSKINQYFSSFRRLFTKQGAVDRVSQKEEWFFEGLGKYFTNQDRFNEIPSSPFAYWISNRTYEVFEKFSNIGSFANAKQGLITGNNDLFMRLWNEIDITKFSCSTLNREDTKVNKYKWYPYNKGGEYRKWFGNNYYVVNWENDGYEIQNFTNDKGKLRSRPQNLGYYFKEGLTWTALTAGVFSMRYSPRGYLFDAMGPVCFVNEKEQQMNILGLLNSVVGDKFLKILSPNLKFDQKPLENVPYYELNNKRIVELVNENIMLSKKDWDLYEISWDYKAHPLLKSLAKGKQHKLSFIFTIWETECEEAFEQLKHNEEELNRIFIDIYGLQDELTPEVEDKDITIRKADRERDVKSFISYAVGCILGRYSIDVEGLIYAGGQFKEKWNLEDKKVRRIEKDEDANVTSDSWIDATFLPDGDNIIPITEDEYFEDDIVSRFIEFVRTVYSDETLEENLDFIADSIGRKASETARQAIRRYFIKDFYKDHLKVYQKRPIYWMFESGKNDGFKCLVYMHRYNDQTIAKVRTEYLHTLQRKYEAEINRLQLVADSEEYSAKDRTAAKKKIDRIVKQIEECREYDGVVAYLANEKISIDLDDGVKVNYAKFQDVKVINSKGKEVKMNLLSKI